MEDKMESLEGQQLQLQNALIRQRVDATKLKAELDVMAERADYYENLYNESRRNFYELECKYQELYRQKQETTLNPSQQTTFFIRLYRKIKRKAGTHELD